MTIAKLHEDMCDPPDPRKTAPCGCNANEIVNDIRRNGFACRHGAWTGDKIDDYLMLLIAIKKENSERPKEDATLSKG